MKLKDIRILNLTENVIFFVKAEKVVRGTGDTAVLVGCIDSDLIQIRRSLLDGDELAVIDGALVKLLREERM